MPEILKAFFTSGGFIPHGHCYLWKPALVLLHILSDSLIGLAYYSIPVMLLYFVSKRRDVPFDWIFLMFSSFIVTCGTTHILEVWTIWHPTYWLSGFIKAITALVSLATAVLLVSLIPKALALPSPAQLEAKNLTLSNEITQRTLAEEALRESEERLQAIVDNSTALFYLTDTQNKLLLINRRYEDLFHINREQALGKSLYKIWSLEIADAFVRNNQQVLEAGKVLELEEVVPHNNDIRTYLSIKFPLYNSSGVAYAVCGISTDITERKRIEEALRRAHDELEIRVQERTAELASINESLQVEIDSRKRVEETLLRRTRQLEIISRASLQINSILEIPAVMRTLIASAIELVGATAGTYGLMSQGKMVFTEYQEKERIRSIDVTFERKIGVPGWVMDTLQPYVANDAEHDSLVLPHFQKAFGFYNLVNIPIFNRKNELIGCFELHNKAEHRPFSENDITMLQGLAASAAVALENSQMLVERKQVEEALRWSEQRFRAIFNLAAVGIVQLEVDGSFLLVNQKFCDIVGYTREELFRRTFRDISHPDDLEANLEYVRRMLAGEIQMYSMEKRYIRKDTSPVWINLTVSLVLNSSGKPKYLIAIVEDISDRKQAEKALRKSEARFRVAVNNMPNVFVIYDAERRLKFVNAEGLRLSGLRLEELLGHTDEEIFPPEVTQGYLPTLRLAVKTRTTQTTECTISLPNFEPYTIIATYVPLLDEQGEIYQILGITHDITERKRAEEERERLLRQLEQERSQLEAVLQQMPAGVIIAEAPSGRLILGNQKMEQIWRLPFLPSEAIEQYQDWKGFYSDGRPYQPQDWPLARSLNTGEVVTQEEIEILRGDGTRGVILVSSTPIRDAQGCIIAGVVTFYDITQRKTAEKQLWVALQKLSFHVENSPLAVVEINHEGRLLRWSKQAEKIFGWKAEEVLGRYWQKDWKIFFEEDFEAVKTDISALINGTQSSNVSRNRNYTKDGSVIDCEWYNSALFDESGKLVSTLSLVQDVTERTKAEREIRELNSHLERRVAERTAELEATNKELEAFSYSVSHDLRAPLRGIDGFSQALLERYADKLDEKGKHYLQRIRAGTQRMSELIDDLLKLSRVTRSEMHRTKVDLSTLAREIAAELYSTQPERQVEWAIAPGLLANGDVRLLRVVLENLLNNAWKFTSNRLHARIEFNAILNPDGRCTYFVRDNGAGFNMAYADKLFGAFVRLHSATEFPGTGIGLATIQRIIHRHSGRVWAEGAVEQGATFYFIL